MRIYQVHFCLSCMKPLMQTTQQCHDCDRGLPFFCSDRVKSTPQPCPECSAKFAHANRNEIKSSRELEIAEDSISRQYRRIMPVVLCFSSQELRQFFLKHPPAQGEAPIPRHLAQDFPSLNWTPNEYEMVGEWFLQKYLYQCYACQKYSYHTEDPFYVGSESGLLTCPFCKADKCFETTFRLERLKDEEKHKADMLARALYEAEHSISKEAVGKWIKSFPAVDDYRILVAITDYMTDREHTYRRTATKMNVTATTICKWFAKFENTTGYSIPRPKPGENLSMVHQAQMAVEAKQRLPARPKHSRNIEP